MAVHRPAAAAPFQPLAWGLPYASGVALKKYIYGLCTPRWIVKPPESLSPSVQSISKLLNWEKLGKASWER